MKPSAPSKTTWISLAERAPPECCARPLRGRRCWLWFWTTDRRKVLGLYEGAGQVRLKLRDRGQLSLALDVATHWAPMDEDLLQEFEDAELAAHTTG